MVKIALVIYIVTTVYIGARAYSGIKARAVEVRATAANEVYQEGR